MSTSYVPKGFYVRINNYLYTNSANAELSAPFYVWEQWWKEKGSALRNKNGRGRIFTFVIKKGRCQIFLLASIYLFFFFLMLSACCFPLENHPYCLLNAHGSRGADGMSSFPHNTHLVGKDTLPPPPAMIGSGMSTSPKWANQSQEHQSHWTAWTHW